MTQIARGLARGISDVARGLSASSQRWPGLGLAQQQMRRQDKQTEEERRRDRAQAYLQLVLKTGNPDLVAQALERGVQAGTLPEGAASAEMAAALATPPSPDPAKWTRDPRGLFYRTNPQTGVLETMKTEFYEPPPEETDPVFRVSEDGGFLIRRSGKQEPLEPRFRRALQDARQGGKQFAAVDKDRGVMYFKDGTAEVVDLPEDALGNKVKTSDIYEHYVNQVLAGKMSTAAARDAVKGTLLRRGMKAEDAEAEAAAMASDFGTYRMRIEWTPKESALLNASNELSRAADVVLGMLSDPGVRSKLGRVPGLYGRALRWFTGGKSDDPKVTAFLTQIGNLKDKLVTRERTGAAMNLREESFYDNLLGSDITDPDALETKMVQLLAFEKDAVRSLWETGLIRKDEPYTQEDLETLPYYQPKNLRTKNQPRTGLTLEQLQHGAP